MIKSIGPTFAFELIAAGCNNGVSFTIGGTDADIEINGIALGAATGIGADAVRAVVSAHDSSRIDAREQIAVIEASQPVTQRALRELILAIGQAFPAAQQSVFYKKAVAQEQQIASLRSQL